jgi:hypothetical protein
MNTTQINPMTDIFDPLRAIKELLAVNKWQEAAVQFNQLDAASRDYDQFDTSMVKIRLEAGAGRWSEVEKWSRVLIEEFADRASADELLPAWQMLIAALDVQQKDAESARARQEAIDFFSDQATDLIDAAAWHYRSLLQLQPDSTLFSQYPGVSQALRNLTLEGEDFP